MKQLVSPRRSRHFPLLELKAFLPTILIMAQLATLTFTRLPRANVHPFLQEGGEIRGGVRIDRVRRNIFTDTDGKKVMTGGNKNNLDSIG